MKDKDEFLKDDYLRKLMQHIPLDNPSDDFVNRVMNSIQPAPEAAIVKKPFYFYLKAVVPYSLITILLVFVLGTSDLPLFNWLPGKDFLANNLPVYFGSLFTVLKTSFASRYVSWALLISFSAGMLFLIDRIFSRRTSV